jgi:hypothetical protein
MIRWKLQALLYTGVTKSNFCALTLDSIGFSLMLAESTWAGLVNTFDCFTTLWLTDQLFFIE